MKKGNPNLNDATCEMDHIRRGTCGDKRKGNVRKLRNYYVSVHKKYTTQNRSTVNDYLAKSLSF